VSRWLLTLLPAVGLLFVARPAAGADCVPPPAGLIAWWRGEQSGYDEVGTNHGVLVNEPTFAPGVVGHAFNFKASFNSAAVIPSAPELNPTNAITIEAWVKPFSFPDTGPCIVRKNLDTTGGTQYSLMLGDGLTNGLLHMNVAASLGGTSVSGGFVPTNVWTHVVGTYDRQYVRIYVNGTEVGNASSSVAIPASLQAVLIGNEDSLAGDRAFDGLIDELAIYNRALSASEIAAIYAAGSAGKCGRRIEWFEIAGGGGESTNASCRLRGTVGQHDAGGPLTNTMFSLVGPSQIAAAAGLSGCAEVSSGAVAWWKAEGDALDSTGANHGTVFGATFAPGQVGQAFGFDGLNDGISVPDAVALRPVTNLTLEGWIKTPGIPEGSQAGFIVARSGNAFTGYEFLIGTPSQGGRLRFTINGGIGGADFFSTNSVTDNSFHHVAATYDGTVIRVYRDGVLDGQKAFAQPITYQERDPLWIGRREFASIPGHFAGLVDELTIYNRALSASEIAAIHAAGLSGKCPSRPTLNIAALPGAVRLTWTTNATGYLLETNSALTFPVGWGVLTSNYSVLETNYAVTNVLGGATRFYRLHKP
jgi:hypothetical protein